MKSAGDWGGLPKDVAGPFVECPDAPPRTDVVVVGADALTAPLAAAAAPVVAAVVGQGG